MNLMRVGSYLQMVVIGALLIVAIGAEYFRQQMLSQGKKITKISFRSLFNLSLNHYDTSNRKDLKHLKIINRWN